MLEGGGGGAGVGGRIGVVVGEGTLDVEGMHQHHSHTGVCNFYNRAAIKAIPLQIPQAMSQ